MMRPNSLATVDDIYIYPAIPVIRNIPDFPKSRVLTTMPRKAPPGALFQARMMATWLIAQMRSSRKVVSTVPPLSGAGSLRFVV